MGDTVLSTFGKLVLGKMIWSWLKKRRKKKSSS